LPIESAVVVKPKKKIESITFESVADLFSFDFIEVDFAVQLSFSLDEHVE